MALEEFVREMQLGGGSILYGQGLLRLSGSMSGESGQQLLDRCFIQLGEMLEKPRGGYRFELCLTHLDGPCHGLFVGGLEALDDQSDLTQDWNLLWSTPPHASKIFYLARRLNQQLRGLSFLQRPTRAEECGNCPAACFG